MFMYTTPESIGELLGLNTNDECHNVSADRFCTTVLQWSDLSVMIYQEQITAPWEQVPG